MSTVGATLTIRMKKPGVAGVKQAAAVPCDTITCGDPHIRCAMLYAGWTFSKDPIPTPFDPLVDFLPLGAFNFYVIPGPDTKQCGDALFLPLDVHPLSWFVQYVPGTDPTDYSDNFTMELVSHVTGVWKLTATGAGNYAGGQLVLYGTAVQSMCEDYHPGDFYAFGPPIVLNFTP